MGDSILLGTVNAEGLVDGAIVSGLRSEDRDIGNEFAGAKVVGEEVRLGGRPVKRGEI